MLHSISFRQHYTVSTLYVTTQYLFNATLCPLKEGFWLRPSHSSATPITQLRHAHHTAPPRSSHSWTNGPASTPVSFWTQRQMSARHKKLSIITGKSAVATGMTTRKRLESVVTRAATDPLQRPIPGWLVGGNQGGARGRGYPRGRPSRGRGPSGAAVQWRGGNGGRWAPY